MHGPEVSEHGKRLDAFVDAAFAFAVTLLVISGGDPPKSLAELTAALWNIPAFALSFALVALFWSHHRNFARITARRDGAVMWLSLGIVFVVLVFVFPLRLLAQTALGFMSGGLLPGRGALRSYADLRTLYAVYGFGYGLLCLLYAGLFACAARADDASPAGRAEARTDTRIWAAIAALGVASGVSALLVPLQAEPWLPGMLYALVPLAVWLVGGWKKPQDASAATRPPHAPG